MNTWSAADEMVYEWFKVLILGAVEHPSQIDKLSIAEKLTNPEPWPFPNQYLESYH